MCIPPVLLYHNTDETDETEAGEEVVLPNDSKTTPPAQPARSRLSYLENGGVKGGVVQPHICYLILVLTWSKADPRLSVDDGNGEIDGIH